MLRVFRLAVASKSCPLDFVDDLVPMGSKGIRTRACTHMCVCAPQCGTCNTQKMPPNIPNTPPLSVPHHMHRTRMQNIAPHHCTPHSTAASGRTTPTHAILRHTVTLQHSHLCCASEPSPASPRPTRRKGSAHALVHTHVQLPRGCKCKTLTKGRRTGGLLQAYVHPQDVTRKHVRYLRLLPESPFPTTVDHERVLGPREPLLLPPVVVVRYRALCCLFGGIVHRGRHARESDDEQNERHEPEAECGTNELG